MTRRRGVEVYPAQFLPWNPLDNFLHEEEIELAQKLGSRLKASAVADAALHNSTVIIHKLIRAQRS